MNGSIGENHRGHFVDVNKMVEIDSGTQRRIDDIVFSRFAQRLQSLIAGHSSKYIKRKLDLPSELTKQTHKTTV